MSDMIADGLNYTLKKSQKTKLIIPGIGVLTVLLIGLIIRHDCGVVALTVFGFTQAGMVLLISDLLSKSAKKSLEIRMLKQKQSQLVFEIKKNRNSSEARLLFIDRFGKILLGGIRTVYEGVGFINALDKSEAGLNVLRDVEKELLENTAQLYEFSCDVVTLSQLENSLAMLVEQDIDPVELARFCILAVEKNNNVQESIEFVDQLSRTLILRADLGRLKQSLIKLLDFSVDQVKPNGGRVKMSAYYQKGSGFAFTVKLDDTYLSGHLFNNYCFPLRNTAFDQVIDMRLAIAHHLAILHGGRLVIRGQTSTGTELALELPEGRVRPVMPVAGKEPIERISIF